MGPPLIEALQRYLRRMDGCIVDVVVVIFIVCNKGLDFSTPESPCSIYVLAENTGSSDCGLLTCKYKGPLASVNAIATDLDIQLASLIDSGDVDALISMSSDPEQVNAKSSAAAVAAGIPICGTGGKSMSHIASAGGLVVGSSGGSVASTQISRAICFSHALAGHWRCTVRPESPPAPSLHSIMGAALPLLLTSSLATAAIDCLLYASKESSSPIALALVELRQRVSAALVCVPLAAIACNESSRLQELSYITGAAIGALNPHSLLGALSGGVLGGRLLPRLLALCAQTSLLPTAATILSVGGSALISGISAAVATYYLPSSLLAGVEPWPLPLRLATGAVLGVSASWGSENGYYHTAMLPLIALEMQGGSFGVFGCLDVLCLCVPSAAVCSAAAVFFSLLAPHVPPELKEVMRKRSAQLRLGRRGALSNLLMGDFVEACYPYSLRYPSILLSIRVACAAAGAIVLGCDLHSSAYLPLPLSLLLPLLHSQHGTLETLLWMTAAASITFILPFTATLVVLTMNRSTAL